MGKHNHKPLSPTTGNVPVICTRNRPGAIINAVVVDRPSPKTKEETCSSRSLPTLGYMSFLSVSNAYTH